MLERVESDMSFVGVGGFAGGLAIANITCSEKSEYPMILIALNMKV